MALWLVVAGFLLLSGMGYEALARKRDRLAGPPGRLIDIGGRLLHMTDRGEGGPTVVVLTGAGDSAASWVHVQKEVSRFARVIVYDRAGLGYSDPGPAPTPEGWVSDLKALLDHVGAPGPYVLVGHSLGGLIARAFASTFSTQVAGLVLLDSTPEAVAGSRAVRRGFAALRGLFLFLRWLSPLGVIRIWSDLFGTVPLCPERKRFEPLVTGSEYRQWKESVYRNLAGSVHAEYQALFALAEACAPAARPGQFGGMPLAVLASPTFGPQWIQWQREIVTRSGNSRFWLSPEPGHNLHMTSPDRVVDAIEQVVIAVR